MISFRFMMLALLLASLLGCSASRAVTVNTVDLKSSKSWVGRTDVDLETVWGEAGSKKDDGLGGTIWTYLKVSRFIGSAAVGPPGHPETAVGPDGQRLGIPVTTTGTALEASKKAEFRIDKGGKIYHYQIASEFQDKRELKPPPRAD